MERKTFELIEAICREGLTNDVWGVIENGNTGDWFGDKEPHELHGQYLYVYNEADDRQDELLKNYFNPSGNKYQSGFDDNPKRQIDFVLLIGL